MGAGNRGAAAAKLKIGGPGVSEAPSCCFVEGYGVFRAKPPTSSCMNEPVRLSIHEANSVAPSQALPV